MMLDAVPQVGPDDAGRGEVSDRRIGTEDGEIELERRGVMTHDVGSSDPQARRPVAGELDVLDPRQALPELSRGVDAASDDHPRALTRRAVDGFGCETCREGLPASDEPVLGGHDALDAGSHVERLDRRGRPTSPSVGDLWTRAVPPAPVDR